MSRKLFWIASIVLSSVPLAWSQEIQVKSADPPSAPQGTVNLNVTIRGNGFKKGAQSNFFVTGTQDPGGIGVNQTTFVSSAELVANITVADTAVIAKFDIEVLSGGRRGKGTELFSVTEKGNSLASLIPVEAVLRDGVDDKIRSDGQGIEDGLISDSAYNDSEICVIGWSDNTNGRFFLRTDGRDSACDVQAPDRKLVLDFSDAIERNGTCVVDDAFGQNGTLNICGVNFVTDVRIIADKLFQNMSPTTTPVILAFSLVRDFRYTAFELQFEQAVPASGDVSSTRVLSAPAGAVAELYKNQAKGKKLSLGRFQMPFEIEVTLQQ
ncbi:MAG TPA: hypothetical protein VLK65_12325 [Vicinamibacteria bacterium]|nr:hypothetical protein [Vicinamibacteria bacterium]